MKNNIRTTYKTGRASIGALLVLAAILLLPTTTLAQVTIGSGEKPNKATILDVKENANTGVNAKGGVGLPRVLLTDKNALFPMFEADGSDYKQGTNTFSKSDEDKKHTGLWVYNTGDCGEPFPRYKGLYVWDATQWVYQGRDYEAEQAKQVETFIDTRDGEEYRIRNFGEAGTWMLENLRFDPKRAKDDTGYEDYEESFYHEYKIAWYFNEYDTDIDFDKELLKKRYHYADDTAYIIGTYPTQDWKDNKKKWGIRYNWNAANNRVLSSKSLEDYPAEGQGDTTPLEIGPQGVCPKGWHIPSDKEWNMLERHIYGNAHLYSHFSEAEVKEWNKNNPWQKDWETNTQYKPAGTGVYGDFAEFRPAIVTGDMDIKGHGGAMVRKCLDCNGEGFEAQHGGFDIFFTGMAKSYSDSNNLGRVASFGSHAFLWTASRAGVTGSWFRLIRCTKPNSNRNYVMAVSRSSQTKFYDYLSVRCKKN